MRAEDYPAVREIFQAGMDTGEATFEATAPELWEDFMRHRLPELCFVATDANNPGDILGWISGTPASHRPVFRGVVEDSIYVATTATGRGVAGVLLDAFIVAATEAGFWAVHATIFPNNLGSVGLHESRGFRKVGMYHCMAQMTYGPKAGMWRHNLMMEKVLEGGPAWASYERWHDAEGASE